MSDPDAQPGGAPLDSDGRLQTDLECLKCGYNLRSLMTASRCPECGLPVAHSVRGDLLQFSDPRWVAELASGATALLAAGVVSLIAIPCGVVAWPLFDPSGDAAVALIGAFTLPVAIIGAIYILLQTWAGATKLTALEPRTSSWGEALSARLCRGSFLATAVLAGIWALLAGLWLAGSLTRPPSIWGGCVLLPSTLVVGLAVLPVSLLAHLALLFLRVPRKGPADFAIMLSIAIFAADGAMLVQLPIAASMSRTGGPSWFEFLGVLMFGACLLGVLGLLYYARVEFTAAAEEARMNAGSAAIDLGADATRDG